MSPGNAGRRGSRFAETSSKGERERRLRYLSRDCLRLRESPTAYSSLPRSSAAHHPLPPLPLKSGPRDRRQTRATNSKSISFKGSRPQTHRRVEHRKTDWSRIVATMLPRCRTKKRSEEDYMSKAAGPALNSMLQASPRIRQEDGFPPCGQSDRF